MPHLHHDLRLDATSVLGRAAPMMGRVHQITDEEFETQLRDLVRIVSICTLGLWSFSAGLLIGTFYMF